jgi:predicted permease
MFTDLAHEIRTALRALARVPVLTAVIVLTVGIGIGASTAIFAAVDAALLRPLPYADSGRLVWIYTDAPPFKWRFSVADFLALEAQQTHFESVAAYTDRSMAFTTGATAELLNGRVVTASYFRLLGIVPALGRDFAPWDAKPGSAPVVIVSDGFWRQRLGSRMDIVGTAVRLDGADYTVAGVLPPRVGPFERRQDFFLAAQLSPPPRRGPFLYTVVGRLRDGAEPASATAELHAINRRIFPLWESSYQDDKATWNMTDLKARVVGDVGTIAGLSLAAVGLVWLIACVNASNLLVARVTSRRRELVVRAALGASRARVLRPLFVESALLAAAAAALGVVLARVGVDVVRSVGATYLPRTHDVALGGRVLAFLVILAAISAAIFAIVPAFQGSGMRLDQSLRSGRSSTAGVGARRLRQGLVAGQFAICTPLLIVAALLLVSLNALRQVDLGFDTRNVVTATVRLPSALYQREGSVAAFWAELLTRLQSLPGVVGVAFADGRPPNDVGNFNNFELEESVTPPSGSGQAQPVTPWVAVSPEYFSVLGLTLVEGRLLDARDAQRETIESVVVDRAWARRFFPGQSAIGKRFKEGGCTQCPWTTVVGVVSEVKYAGLEQPDQGTVYWALGDDTSRVAVLRTQGTPSAVLPGVRSVVSGLDANVVLTDVATIDQLVAESLDSSRSLSLLVASLAAIALLLSVVGIYGVMAFYVEQHSRDISIRMALGGRARNVIQLVVGRGLAVVAAGIGLGLIGAFASTRLMATLLFGVDPVSVPTFAAAALGLFLTALAACLIPAVRATRMEPGVLLRD